MNDPTKIDKVDNTETTKKPTVDPGEELVEVELFEDGDKYKGDVTVGVNGEHIQIKRGERVFIKRKFARALEYSEAQKRRAVRFIKSTSQP